MSINQDLLLSVYATVLSERSAVYFSAPVSSGRRFVEWVAQHTHTVPDVDYAVANFKSEHREKVVEPNLAYAKQVVRDLRSRLRTPVIDPTSLPALENWTQSNWLEFWESVLERFAVAVVFADGWQFSFGCVHEFAFAHRNGIPTYDQRGQAIDANHGIALAENALAYVQQVGGRADGTVENLRHLRFHTPTWPPSAPESLTQLVA